MVQFSAWILSVAYPEMSYIQAYASTIRHLRYDTFGKYTIEQLIG
jgi:hypothetical protein